MAAPLRDRAIPRAASAAAGATTSTYREFAPLAATAGVALCTWEGRAGWSRSMRLLPDGCMDLVWDGSALWITPGQRAAVRENLPGGARNVGLRLRSGAGAAVLGVPADALPGTKLRLDTIWGASATAAESQLRSAVDAREARRRLEDLLVARLRKAQAPDPAVLAACERLRTRQSSIDQVANAVGLTPRELRRRFQAHVGFGPKALQRIFRLQALLRALGADGPRPAELVRAALEAGYADQAHATREARALSGSTPAGLRWALHL